jgi:tRNA threonylcarbamoyladenosine biosynthesis protein TsaE
MNLVISHSPGETEALGQSWASEVADGWVIGLIGDLGAGKTQLVRGFARALGVTGRIHSPTFALVNEYSGGRLPLFHLDLYRLETRGEIIGAGLEEYLVNPKGVSVVEWFERWASAPESFTAHEADPRTHYRIVRIEQTAEMERRIIYEDFGP